MAGLGALFAKQLYRFLRSPMEIMGSLFMPVLLVGMFGMGMASALGPAGGGGFGGAYLAFMAPGAVALAVLSSAVVGGATLLQERLNGVLKQYLVAPIPRASILVGTVAASVAKALVQALLVVVLAALLGAALSIRVAFVVPAVSGVLAFALGFAGLAAFFASTAPSMAAYHSVITVFNIPLLFASNALYPLQTMPGWLRVLSTINPTSYAVELLRFALGGREPELWGVWGDLAALLAFAVAGVALGVSGARRWALRA